MIILKFKICQMDINVNGFLVPIIKKKESERKKRKK